MNNISFFTTCDLFALLCGLLLANWSAHNNYLSAPLIGPHLRARAAHNLGFHVLVITHIVEFVAQFAAQEMSEKVKNTKQKTKREI